MSSVGSAMGVARYRCTAQTQVPVTLENVSSSQRPMYFFGSPSAMAWSALAVVGMRMHGAAKANRLEGKTLTVPASGQATLTDNGIVLNLTISGKVSGVSLRGGAQALDLEIPYRVIRNWGHDQRGVYLDLVRRGPMWLQPADSGDFQQWLAHLSYGKTWQAPVQFEARTEVPIVGWCQQDRRFTFGLPEGWGSPPQAAVADFARDFLPSVLIACVGLNGGQWEPQLVVLDNGLLQIDGTQDLIEALAADFGEASNITPLGSPQLLSVDGDPLVLIRGTSWTSNGWVDRGMGSIAHKGNSFLLWYNITDAKVGDGSYERWLPHVHTMIATWHWYS